MKKSEEKLVNEVIEELSRRIALLEARLNESRRQQNNTLDT